MSGPKTKRNTFLLGFGITFMLAYVVFFRSKDGIEEREQPTPLTIHNVPGPNAMPSYTQQQRLQRINDFCEMPHRTTYEQSYKKVYSFSVTENNYYYERFNTSYCKVPKVGSTFMMEMFQILMSGKTKHVKTRTSVHSATRKFRTRRNERIPTIATARDPYSRLYSAYVDKILLPNCYKMSLKIRSARTILEKSYDPSVKQCENNVTFQEFLDYLVFKARKREVMNRHWAPINAICHFCEANNLMIIKQETFSTDVLEFLERLDISEEKIQTVQNLLTSKRIEVTIPGIVGVVLGRQKTIQKCMTKLQALEKLWMSFQIQGYISEKKPFPENKFKFVAGNANKYFSNIMVMAAKESNLTKTESKRQRQRYLVKAYEGIAEDTLEEIKDIYWADFDLFGYSMEPPTEQELDVA